MQPGHSLNRQQLQRLAREARDLADWTTIRDFARQMYGETTRTVCIHVYSEWSEDSTIYLGTFIEEVAAYNEAGQELLFDLSLPFFQCDAWRRAKGEDDGDDLGRYKAMTWLEGEELQRDTWILFGDLPAVDATYDLSVIPSLFLPSWSPMRSQADEFLL